MYIASNVRGMKSSERIEELCSSINQQNIFAKCIQETWRSDVEVLQHGNCCILGAGLKLDDNSKHGSQGVCIVLSTAACYAWKAAGSEIHNKYVGRVIAVRLLVQDTQCRNLYLFLVSAYAPVGNSDQSIWAEYLRNLDNCINQKRTKDILVIGSDTNSSMGSSNGNTCLGTFGISYVNESGRRFASHLAINNLIAATTCFRKKSYGTWIHPRSKNVHQRDHFLAESNTIYRISDAGVTTPLLDSDHPAIKCKVKIMLRLKKITTQRKRLALHDYTALSNENLKKYFCSTTLKKFNSNGNTSSYTRLAESTQQTATKLLPNKNLSQGGSNKVKVSYYF